jgi:hypothetical protein
MKKTAALFTMLLLLGCASTGVQVNEDQLRTFEKGKTTVADVTAVLGQPTTSSLQSDGSRMLIYSYAQAQARPASFIPIVGAFVGGTDARSNVVMFRFDAKGVLMDYSSTSSTYGTGTGMAAGAPMPQTDQPRQAK